MSIIFLFSSVMILFSGLLQLMMDNNSAAIFQILVAFLFVYDAYIYIRPYLGLDEEKIIVNNGLLKKEIILLKDVTSIDEKKKKLIITYSQGPTTKTLKILLSQLRERDKEQFMENFKSKLGEKVCVGSRSN